MSVFHFIIDGNLLYVMHESIISVALKKNSTQASDKLIDHVHASGILECGLAGFKFVFDGDKIVGTSMYPAGPTYTQMCEQLQAWNRMYGAISDVLTITPRVMKIFN